MKFRPAAILFDMDGVLIDSLGSWLKALNHALRHYNKKEISLEEFVEKYWGHDLFHNLKKMGIPLEVGLFCNQVYRNHLNGIKKKKNQKNILNGIGVHGDIMN